LSHVVSVPDDAPVRWRSLFTILGAGVPVVAMVASMLQHREIAPALVYLAGAAVLGIFG
jgi:hypothetical protein